MQRVGHDDAIQRGQRQRLSKIRDEGFDLCRRKPPPHVRGEAAQNALVSIDRGDMGARPEKIGERHRESAIARAQVGPISTLRVDTSTKEADELSLIHVFRFRRRRPACPRRLKALHR